MLKILIFKSRVDKKFERILICLVNMLEISNNYLIFINLEMYRFSDGQCHINLRYKYIYIYLCSLYTLFFFLIKYLFLPFTKTSKCLTSVKGKKKEILIKYKLCKLISLKMSFDYVNLSINSIIRQKLSVQ